MNKRIGLALVGTTLCGCLHAITVFERNSFSLLQISDIPQPVSFENQAVNAPPGVAQGFAGAPEAGGAGGAGLGDAVEGEAEYISSDPEASGTPGEHEGGTGEAAQEAAEQGGGGKGATGKGGTQGTDRENREGDRENREREREARERDSREDRDRESRERDTRGRESRERGAKENKQKEDRSRDKKKGGRGTDSEGDGKEKSGPGFRERSASNFREVARLAEGPSTTASDMPTKFVSKGADMPLPYWPIPSTTIGTPSAHGADWTDVFAGVGVQNRARFGTLPNSTAIVGFGLGNSIKNVGLEVGISSYGLIRHGLPFTTGGISFKLHHYFRDWQLGVAAGYENAIYWKAPDSGQSFYLVFSKYFLLGKGSRQEPFRTLFVHAGLGDGRFRTEGAVRAGRNAISPFLAVAVRAADPVNLVLNWTGSDLAAGVSVTPFRTTPISIGLSALDILKQAGDGVRFSMVFSYGDSVTAPSFPVSWFRPVSSSRLAAR